MSSKVVDLSILKKMAKAAEKEYEIERQAEGDPKLKAKIKVQEMAKKHLDEINEIMSGVSHLIKTDEENPTFFEIVTESELKKPGKTPGAKAITLVKNPHTGETIEIIGSGKNIIIPEKYFEWRGIFGPTAIAKWIVTDKDSEQSEE